MTLVIFQMGLLTMKKHCKECAQRRSLSYFHKTKTLTKQRFDCDSPWILLSLIVAESRNVLLMGGVGGGRQLD